MIRTWMPNDLRIIACSCYAVQKRWKLPVASFFCDTATRCTTAVASHPTMYPQPLSNRVPFVLCQKAVLIQYDILAGSDGKQARATSSASTSSSSIAESASSSSSSRNGGFQPLTSSGEKLVDEITGLLGGDSLQGMGRKLMADLKSKMGTADPPSTPTSSPGVNQHQQPKDAQGSDPKAKYMEKVRVAYVGDLHFPSYIPSKSPGFFLLARCCHFPRGHI